MTFRLNPITRKRLQRFRGMKRAWVSLWLLTAIYAVSMISELLCNDTPLLIRCEGKLYAPVLPFVHHGEDAFLHNGVYTTPNWKELAKHPLFAANDANWMLMAPVPHGPNEIANPADLPVPDEVTVQFRPQPRSASVNVNADLAIVRSVDLSYFFGLPRAREFELRDRQLDAAWELPARLREGIARRLANEAAPAIEASVQGPRGRVVVSMRAYEPRQWPPPSVHLRIAEAPAADDQLRRLVFGPTASILRGDRDLWDRLEAAKQEDIRVTVRRRFEAVVESRNLSLAGESYLVTFEKEDIRFPFRPIGNHYLGLDEAGRDVLARILYATRISMNFGFLLVLFATSVGIVIGAIQGYFAGAVDILAQRGIEIWGSIPFLYVMILISTLWGRSFALLLGLFTVFNWIGTSYYMRAEFLRLRSAPFVEAAKCLGLPTHRIIFGHVLPNALVPVITFFPFSLVGAITVLSSLDYLGFGLPPPTPSWGELLHQAQTHTHAWWLIVFPFIALFAVVLLGVFIGEGVRAAYDPKRFARMT